MTHLTKNIILAKKLFNKLEDIETAKNGVLALKINSTLKQSMLIDLAKIEDNYKEQLKRVSFESPII